MIFAQILNIDQKKYMYCTLQYKIRKIIHREIYKLTLNKNNKHIRDTIQMVMTIREITISAIRSHGIDYPCTLTP